jgi:type II secretory pathway pseudopilin PulG
MKAKLLVVAVIGAIILCVWYANTVNTQKATLQQSGERLRLAQQHVDSGNLKAANSLLIQVGIDLAALDKFYTLPSINRQRQNLSRDLGGVRERFQANLATIKDALSELTASGKSGSFQKAEATIRTAVTRSEKNATLLGLVRYLDRLKAQDFKGADDSIGSVTSNLPDELNVADIANNLAAFVQSERNANRESQSRIAAAVKARVDLSGARASSGWQPMLKGRAMVWDFTKETIDQAYELLPDDLRASSRDGVVTMFCIVKRENIERGRYSISNQPAYQEKMTVGVVYWPQKVSPGSAVVWGGEPPSSRPVRYSPEYGSAVKIKEWVAGLPRK